AGGLLRRRRRARPHRPDALRARRRRRRSRGRMSLVERKPSERVQARRAQFQRYKQDVKDRGKPFYPFAMFHDTVMSLVVVLTMGVLTYKGATARESLASEVVAEVPKWAKAQGFENNPQALAGANLFAESSCLTCHVYMGSGSANLGAPELTAEGAKNKGIAF